MVLAKKASLRIDRATGLSMKCANCSGRNLKTDPPTFADGMTRQRAVCQACHLDATYEWKTWQNEDILRCVLMNNKEEREMATGLTGKPASERTEAQTCPGCGEEKMPLAKRCRKCHAAQIAAGREQKKHAAMKEPAVNWSQAEKALREAEAEILVLRGCIEELKSSGEADLLRAQRAELHANQEAAASYARSLDQREKTLGDREERLNAEVEEVQARAEVEKRSQERDQAILEKEKSLSYSVWPTNNGPAWSCAHQAFDVLIANRPAFEVWAFMAKVQLKREDRACIEEVLAACAERRAKG